MSEEAFAPALAGFSFENLFSPERLRDLDTVFRADLSGAEPELSRRLEEGRANPDALSPLELSKFLTDLAPHVSRFIARIFPIEAAQNALRGRAQEEAVLGRFKRDFLTRRVVRLPDPENFASLDWRPIAAKLTEFERGRFPDLPWNKDEELATTRMGVELLDAENAYAEVLRQKKRTEVPEEIRKNVRRWMKAAGTGTENSSAEEELAFLESQMHTLAEMLHLRMIHPEWQKTIRHWASFRVPGKQDFEALVPTERRDPAMPEKRCGPESLHRRRDGFKLTGHYMSPREITAETRYCLICHEREKDSCSRGFFDAKTGQVQKNPLGVTLTGCPLDEKISEMHMLRRQGDSVAALAIICVDNPMCPGTGHRICNDCMKGCIYQKQTPVNIPQIETGVLSEVLAMPWGFEVYSLLTRWNPLNLRRPWPLPYNGKNVLVVGLGPAGYTLAHHLLNEGFGVAAIDALKIEPFPGEKIPITDYSRLRQELDQRPLAGFGGVSEYGVTIRWDKNFLTVIARNLARRDHFEIFDGVRFGGTVTVEEAFSLGFDHVAIAAGAGRPAVVEIENNMIRGIRAASDFLMAIQLGGAFRKNGLPNLQAELPAVIIGGGLTAIDTSTELLAYYPIEAEKTLHRWEELCRTHGEERLLADYDPEERGILERLLAHGRLVAAERQRALAAGEQPDFARLCRQWGGVAIVYRRRLEESPGYRVNHEEVLEAFEEGIDFIEGMTPLAAIPDEFGKLKAMKFRRPGGETVEIPARTCFYAAGTTPNVSYIRQLPESLPLDETGRFFAPHRAEQDGAGQWRLVPSGPNDPEALFCGREFDGKFVTFYGDNHPWYSGNVVKAMASAKHGAPKIAALFEDDVRQQEARGQPAREERWATLANRLRDDWRAKVESVRRLTPKIVELTVHAPAAARAFAPGQFYRLQNYEANAPVVDGHPLLMEPLMLTAAWKDEARGLLGMIAVESGVSSRLCAALKPGEPLVVMGPTGSPTEIPNDSTVVLCGGGAGNAILFSIGAACRARGNRVIYFAGFREAAELYRRDLLEAACDVAVYSVESGKRVVTGRPHDMSFTGDIVATMVAYAAGEEGQQPIPLREARHIIVAGSDRMMAAVARARRTVLASFLSPAHTAVASLNSPMQCAMQEVCARCLQKHIDPATGKTSEIVFSCFRQDQCLDVVDWDNLSERLRQDSVAEKISNRWLDRLLTISDPRTA